MQIAAAANIFHLGATFIYEKADYFVIRLMDSVSSANKTAHDHRTNGRWP